jgi:hypothetical protein
MKTRATRLVLALLLLTLAILSPALSQSPPVPTASPSVGFAPFTASFQPNINSGSLYQWQFNYEAGAEFVPDYTSETPTSINFTYQRKGDYVTRVRIFDTASGLPTDYDVPITVYPPPVPPKVSIVGSDPHYAGTGVPATFSAKALASPGLTIASYHWEFLGASGTEIATAGGPTSSATFTYAATGTYTVKVTAIDIYGLAGFATFTTQVILPPTVGVYPGTKDPNYYAARGQPYSLWATATADSGRTIVEYDWDFDGDGVIDLVQPGSGGNYQSFTFPLSQVYLARVTAIDDVGIPGTATLAVPVYLLLESAGSSDRPTRTIPYPLVATTYFPPAPGPTVLSYTWDFGDGTTANTGPAGNTISHAWDDAGTHFLRVTAHLSDGSAITSPEFTVHVLNLYPFETVPLPIASLVTPASVAPPADTSVRVGHPTSFSALAYAGSGPNGNAALTQVAWDFDGDGIRDYIEDFTAAKLLQATSTATYQYQYPGVYTVKVVAGTTYGQTLSGVFKVTVTQGTPPVDCWLVQPADGKTVGGNHVTLSARGSPANNISSLTFQYRAKGASAWKTIAKVVPPPASALSTAWNAKALPKGTYELQAVVAGVDGSSSASWSIQPVTVKIDPNVASDDDETADDNGIPLVRIQTVDPNRVDRSEISQDTRIEFPPHSTTATGSNYARFRIERIGADPHPVETRFQGIVFVPGLFRRLDLGSDSLTSSARVCFYVPNASVDQALAEASINRASAKDLDLTIYRFDDVETHSWVPLFSHVRQPSEALVRASMVAMGDLGVGFQPSALLGREAANSGGSWSGCGALGLDGLLLVLLLSRVLNARSKGMDVR